MEQLASKDADVTARHISNQNLLICDPSTPLHRAASLMKNGKTSSILVKDNAEFIGIWTESDCTKICFDKHADFELPISQFMSSPVISIEQDSNIPQIVRTFHRHRVRHLLVLDHNNNPVGITSQTDVIRNQGIEHYLRLRKVRDSFNTRIPIIDSFEVLNVVSQQMRQTNCTSALIYNRETNTYGIITERDLLVTIASKRHGSTAWQHATRPLHTINEEDSLFKAYTCIKEQQIRHLVVKNAGEITGVLSLQHVLSDIELTYVQQLVQVLNERDLALKESKKHLSFAEKIIRESLDSIMVTDKNGTILSVNPAFSALTGYSPEEVVGKNANILSSGSHDKTFYRQMWRSIRHQGTWQGEVINKKKNGQSYSEWLTIVRLKEDENEDCKEHFAAIFSDITERKKNKQRIHALAFYDELTGLPNRRLFNDRFDIAISTAHRNNQLVGALFLDLDRFKTINDTLGHNIGDELLMLTAQRLSACIKEGDTVSRFGGDEFVVLLTAMLSLKDIVNVVERISTVLSEPYEIDNRELHITSSIGISIYPNDGKTPDTLIKHADLAMYKAKDNGRNAFQLYSPQMNHVSMERLIMQNHLRNALKKQELQLHYQLKVNQIGNRVLGSEALLRWRHQELGAVSPAQFIPMAEEIGLIVEIDRWVLLAACRQRKLWLDRGLNIGPVSVNISPIHFKHDLVWSVKSALETSGLPGHFLEIEVTEGCFIENMESVQAMLAKLKTMGVMISIDDFGTGYSSLSYLSQLKVDILKIDASFVAKVPDDPQQCQIVTAIVAMAKALDLSLVAEGVENTHQIEFLQRKGCDMYQGYYFSKPSRPELVESQILEIHTQESIL